MNGCIIFSGCFGIIDDVWMDNGPVHGIVGESSGNMWATSH